MKKNRKKFKSLAASDLHGESKLAKKLAETAQKEKVDLVILCGDIVDFRETKDILKPFKDRDQKVIILPGNWESLGTTELMAEFYGVKNIHGYSLKYDNLGIFGAGGAQGPGPGNISESEIWKTLEKAHANLKGIEKKIMVTHSHPSGSLSEFSGIPGSKAITKAINKFKPDLLLHGHIHEAEGAQEMIGKTRVINVGRNGAIIEI